MVIFGFEIARPCTCTPRSTLQQPLLVESDRLIAMGLSPEADGAKWRAYMRQATRSWEISHTSDRSWESCRRHAPRYPQRYSTATIL